MKKVEEVEKNERKVFTEKRSNSTIKKNHNPLKVNYKLIYKKRSGLYSMKNVVSEEIKKELDLKGRIILYMFPKTCIKIYGIASKNTINNTLI